ncbi:gliding motility lipoprotein GldB [Rhizosphaericola mali]|uniref:Gliding motility lipoprotein GldB n=1 Tax=Rhizosphaericola mali TaxID=2545455 RepID=A0A5P2G4T6_9BACT|nr:hypothetical protein [Rhizosphaericola mali]QES90535.1 hypothetical protein E0W69_018350 [Rhizosphaericola mali]
MKKILFFICPLILLFGCKDKKRNVPDVSNVKASLKVVRFEQDLFAPANENIDQKLGQLDAKYGNFTKDFLYNIVGIPPFPDSVRMHLPTFIHDYQSINDSVQVHFKDLNKTLEPLQLAMKLIHVYFPFYKAPDKLITFVGPFDGYGNVLTSSGMAVGLQMYLGKDFPAYNTEYIQTIYPAYITRRFEPEYLPVNCVKNLIEDMYPNKSQSLPLVQQMIEAGKRMYVLDQLLPYVADTVKIGYTNDQLEGSYKREEAIWNYFTVNNLLYSIELDETREYVNDGPKTNALGEDSPGNIGTFIGWQIVKKWMEKNEKTTLIHLMDTPADQIFKEAKYKPH